MDKHYRRFDSFWMNRDIQSGNENVCGTVYQK